MNNKYHKYVMIGAFLALLVVAFFIVKSYIIPVLTAAVVAFIFYPVFKWLNKGIKNKFASAIIVTILIIALIIIPLGLSANTMTKEAYLVYLSGKNYISSDILKNCDSVVCTAIQDWSSNVQIQYYFQEGLKTATNYILNWASQFVLTIPKLIIDLFIAIFVIFYLLKDGEVLVKKLKAIFKMEKRNHKIITKKLEDVMYAVVYGNLVIALIQGVIGALSFWVFGISSPIIWGVIMAILSFAPYVGTAMVWIPASLIFIFNGISNNESVLIWQGIGLAFINFTAGMGADNIIKPKMIGKRSSVHPVIILIGIFGGITMFGVAGFIIGPVLLAMTATFVDLYISQNNN